MTKIAVYAIAKNEEKFVQRWYESAKEADYVVLLDTGSDDLTAIISDGLGVITAVERINPWRFDVARNVALDLIPDDADLCVALDLDEVLLPGWREELERAHLDGVTRPRYSYTWSWEGNRPGLVYGGDKIHSRHGYYWKHPVHEVLKPLDGFEEVQGWYGLEIHHHPDSTKSRGHYLPLLALSVEEDPDDDRNAHYYARELYFAGRPSEAIAEFKRHLNLPTAVWPPERARSMRYLAELEPEHAEGWLMAAAQECPSMREPWVDLARLFYNQQRWPECLEAAMTALRIREKPLAYLNDAEAWGPLPHDLAAVAAYNMGLFHEARFHGAEALRLNPYDERLRANLSFYEEAA